MKSGLYSRTIEFLVTLLILFDLPELAAQTVFEEIVVIAEKRNESLQDLSQAVTALKQDELDQKNIISFVDLSSIAPGVTITKNEGFKTVIAIRGLGNEANQNALANPSVSYHLDGVYIASPFSIQTDFLDLERIEVLRGPQGTLFGQNSTGGAINVITSTPTTDEFYGKADFSYGEYNAVRTRASVNVPFNDSAAMRASVSYYNHDGFSDNLVLNQELDDANNLAARLRFLYEPNSNLRLHLSAQYFREDANGAAQKGLLDTTPGARRLSQDSPASYELESQVYSVIAEWDLDDFSIKSLSSYQRDEIFIMRDNDRTDINSLPPFTLLPSFYDPEINEQRTITQELNIISNQALFGNIDWIAGVFYLNSELDVSIRERIDFGFDGVFDPFTTADVFAFNGDFGFITDSAPERESISVYSQSTYHISDTLRAIGGARLTYDKIESAVTNFFGRGGTENLRRSSNAVTGRFALEHDLRDDTLIYASWTRGFKPGGTNLTFGRENQIAPAVVLPVFEDEEINAFELGIKTDFLSGRIRANLAAFYYDYTNLQFQATDPEVFEGGVGNIPQSESYGMELEMLASLTPELSMDFKLSLLETNITESFLALDNVRSDAATNALLFPICGGNLFCPEIQVARANAILDVQGNDLAKAPAVTADLSFRHETPLSNLGTLSSTLQITYRGKFNQRIFNNPTTDKVPSYETVSTVISFDASNERWGLDFLAMNIFNKNGVNARFTDVFGVGSTSDELIPPRQIMGRLRINF
ncbi:MAG: TonB-dependent receptor plug domain-containing protein [Gammaproteobacteria bacterium]|nr:TonB-dependent receptor plug domain-containing protein [Gammaproteobacteria bacterium]